jgi:hypothetical protein
MKILDNRPPPDAPHPDSGEVENHTPYAGSVWAGPGHPRHPHWATATATYVFPGFRPYIQTTANALALDWEDATTARYLSQARDSWHGKLVQQMLSQLPQLTANILSNLIAESALDDAYSHLRLLYLSCVALQEGLKLAILDATSSLSLPHPPWIEDSHDNSSHPPRPSRKTSRP